MFLLTFHIILWNSWHKISLLLQGSHRVPKLTINLGRPIDGSNGGVSSSKKHHKKHKHKKKKKRHIDSDEDDDDVVELSNDSDADYRVWETKKKLISAIKTPDFFCGKNKNQNLFPTTSSLLPPQKTKRWKIFDDDIFSIWNTAVEKRS